MGKIKKEMTNVTASPSPLDAPSRQTTSLAAAARTAALQNVVSGAIERPDTEQEDAAMVIETQQVTNQKDKLQKGAAPLSPVMMQSSQSVMTAASNGGIGTIEEVSAVSGDSMSIQSASTIVPGPLSSGGRGPSEGSIGLSVLMGRDKAGARAERIQTVVEDKEESHPQQSFEESSSALSSMSNIPSPPTLSTQRPHATPGAYRLAPARPPQRAGQADDSHRDSFTQADDTEEAVTTTDISHPTISTLTDQSHQPVLLEATLVRDESEATASPPMLTAATSPQHTLPITVSAEEMDPAMQQGMNKKWVAVGMLTMLVLVAVVAGVVVAVTGGDGDGDGSGSLVGSNQTDRNVTVPDLGTAVPTMAPTQSAMPTGAPTVHPLLAELRAERLSNATLQALEDRTSYQYKAYAWLLQSTPLHEYSLNRVSQLYSLACMYFATQGHLWTFAFEWLNARVSECDWYSTYQGSICSSNDINVSDIDESIIVERLALDRDKIRGQLPEELNLLSNQLTLLSMAKNELSGKLPAWLADLTQLTSLALYENVLTGSLPVNLAALTKLQHLRLGPQRPTWVQGVLVRGFSGRLPGEAFAEWSDLEYLNLAGNSVGLGDLKKNWLSDVSTFNFSLLFFYTAAGNRFRVIFQHRLATCLNSHT